MFKLEKVCKIYKSKENSVLALNEVSLQVKDNEIVSIVGPSGSGKSTLLNVMSTISDISDGAIIYDEVRLDDLSSDEAAAFRLNKFGFVFQKYYLMPTLNVYDNIVLPVILAGRKIDKMYMETLVEMLGISDQVDKMPDQLSGGQQQRVAIARALILKPEVVFADEPTGNLDSKNSENVIHLILDCAKKYKQTVIYVTHDEKMAALAERTIEIKDGKVIP